MNHPDMAQRWRDWQARTEVGYAQLAAHPDPAHQYAALWDVADGLELMCEHTTAALTDPAEVAVLWQDRKLAWQLAACAAHRAGDTDPSSDPANTTPELAWPELEHAASTALRVLRDPTSDAAALHTAYAAVARAVRELGSSATVADRLARIWWQHSSSDLSGKDQ